MAAHGSGIGATSLRRRGRRRQYAPDRRVRQGLFRRSDSRINDREHVLLADLFLCGRRDLLRSDRHVGARLVAPRLGGSFAVLLLGCTLLSLHLVIAPFQGRGATISVTVLLTVTTVLFGAVAIEVAPAGAKDRDLVGPSSPARSCSSPLGDERDEPVTRSALSAPLLASGPRRTRGSSSTR